MKHIFRHRITTLILARSRAVNLDSTALSRTSSYKNQLSLHRPFLYRCNSSSAFQNTVINRIDQTKQYAQDFDNLFESVYQQWIQEVYQEHSDVPHLAEVKKRLHEAIEYNLSNGKRNRAKILVNSYRILAANKMKDLYIREAFILGWCVELLQSFLLILDDIMDESTTRRGSICWYKKENIEMTAINDAIMMNSVIFYLLKKHFRDLPSYVHLVDLFTDITRYTSYGQALDLLSHPMNQKVDLFRFDEERYAAIVRYKTGYYSFCLPIRLALYLTDIVDSRIHAQAEDILLKIGHLFQVQDDYLDCYGDPSITGKIGTDIEDGKCTWLVLQALKRANIKQREAIEQNYGLKCPNAVQEVKKIYQDLELDRVFLEYEKQTCDEICSLIQQIENDVVPKDIFYNVLFLIYRRKK